MKIIADTNVLVRAVVKDDPRQSALAQAELTDATVVAVPLAALCEFAWVLGYSYKISRTDVAAAIRGLMNSSNVVANRAAVAAGLALMDAGGDFADGVIAYEGAWLGAEVFVSFDSQAVRLVAGQGETARLLR